MSARDAWGALLGAAFPSAGRVLWVGDKRLAPRGATEARDLDEIQHSAEVFDGIGWVARAELRAGLATLRPRLSAGGVLVVVLAEPLLLGAVTRALRLAPKADALTLTQACEAFLLTGFEEPRVIAARRPRLALSGRKPARPGLLDAFFEQPAP